MFDFLNLVVQTKILLQLLLLCKNKETYHVLVSLLNKYFSQQCFRNLYSAKEIKSSFSFTIMLSSYSRKWFFEMGYLIQLLFFSFDLFCDFAPALYPFSSLPPPKKISQISTVSSIWSLFSESLQILCHLPSLTCAVTVSSFYILYCIPLFFHRSWRGNVSSQRWTQL